MWAKGTRIEGDSHPNVSCSDQRKPFEMDHCSFAGSRPYIPASFTLLTLPAPSSNDDGRRGTGGTPLLRHAEGAILIACQYTSISPKSILQRTL
jgi:hypothetical protein